MNTDELYQKMTDNMYKGEFKVMMYGLRNKADKVLRIITGEQLPVYKNMFEIKKMSEADYEYFEVLGIKYLCDEDSIAYIIRDKVDKTLTAISKGQLLAYRDLFDARQLQEDNCQYFEVANILYVDKELEKEVVKAYGKE